MRGAYLEDSTVISCVRSISGRQEALTNEKIVKMAKAGLGDDLIVSMIQNEPAKYSLTTDDILKLKEQGVSEKLIKAMVSKGAGNNASGATTGSGSMASGDQNDPMTLHDSGIWLYAKDRSGNPQMIVLERAAYQGSKTGMGCTVIMFKKCKTTAVIPGPKASIRSAESAPVFYFYFEDKAAGLGKSYLGANTPTNPSQFALVKLDVKKTNRETIIGEFSAIGSDTGRRKNRWLGSNPSGYGWGSTR